MALRSPVRLMYSRWFRFVFCLNPEFYFLMCIKSFLQDTWACLFWLLYKIVILTLSLKRDTWLHSSLCVFLSIFSTLSPPRGVEVLCTSAAWLARSGQMQVLVWWEHFSRAWLRSNRLNDMIKIILGDIKVIFDPIININKIQMTWSATSKH